MSFGLLPALLVLVSLTAGPAGAHAAIGSAGPTDTEPPAWSFSLKPYAFLSGLSGSVTAGDVTYPVNSSFGDLVDNLRLGAFVSVAGQRGRWGFLADLEYMSLKGGGSGRVPLELRLDTFIGELDATFGPSRASSLRFLAGVRVFDVQQSLLIADDPAVKASTTVVDPVVGAVASWELGERWRFAMRGDIGGFGISSEFTYQLMLEFQWRLSRSVALPFGYRVLEYQIRQDAVWLDTRLRGLFLGLDLRF